MKFIIYLVTVAMTILLTFNIGIHNGTAATLLFAQRMDRGNGTEISQAINKSSTLTENLRVDSFGDVRLTTSSLDSLAQIQ